MTDYDSSMDQIHRHLVEIATFHCCLNCDHWGAISDRIDLVGCTKYNGIPPAEVIVFGCQDWEPDVPF